MHSGLLQPRGRDHEPHRRAHGAQRGCRAHAACTPDVRARTPTERVAGLARARPGGNESFRASSLEGETTHKRNPPGWSTSARPRPACETSTPPVGTSLRPALESARDRHCPFRGPAGRGAGAGFPAGRGLVSTALPGLAPWAAPRWKRQPPSLRRVESPTSIHAKPNEAYSSLASTLLFQPLNTRATQSARGRCRPPSRDYR